MSETDFSFLSKIANNYFILERQHKKIFKRLEEKTLRISNIFIVKIVSKSLFNPAFIYIYIFQVLNKIEKNNFTWWLSFVALPYISGTLWVKKMESMLLIATKNANKKKWYIVRVIFTVWLFDRYYSFTIYLFIFWHIFPEILIIQSLTEVVTTFLRYS